MYKPLPNCLTIKKSPIEGLGLYATGNIKANSFIGLTHIQDKDFENGYIRTPLGGFYNHSNEPNVRRVVSDTLPKLKCGDLIDDSLDISKIPDGKANRENLYPNSHLPVVCLLLSFSCEPVIHEGQKQNHF